MRRRFIMIWLTLLLLLSSLLAWRILVVGTAPASSTAQTNVATTLTRAPSKHLRPGFMSGVVFPQWGKQAYSNQDKYWHSGLQEIAQQTNAYWLSLPITFHQASTSATTVETRDDIPSPQTVATAIEQAHHDGYQVFIYPLLTVDGPDSWSGQVDFHRQADADAWFASYWQALRPYFVAANIAKADQMSIGNEFELLEGHFSDNWRKLIEKAHVVYNGRVVYSINWSSLIYTLPDWLTYGGLNAIGVSCYFSLVKTPRYLDASTLPQLWQESVGNRLDTLAQSLNKPLFISEIGYRNTHDAGYLPYKADPGTHAPRDDAEQALLYEAALKDIAQDHLITGVFIWAWSVAPYAPNDKPAAHVLQKWFSTL